MHAIIKNKILADILVRIKDGEDTLTDIFHDIMNKYDNYDFELVDDEDTLADFFGLDNFHLIRDAERDAENKQKGQKNGTN